MSMGRRTALRAIMAMPAVLTATAKAAEAQVLSSGAMKSAISSIGGEMYEVEDHTIPQEELETFDEHRSNWWRAKERLQQQRYHDQRAPMDIPAQYTSMKSWSPVMRTHYYAKDEQEFRDLMNVIERDEGLQRKILAALGV